MITAYIHEKKLTPEIITSVNKERLKKAVWIDLLLPTREEEFIVEEYFNINIVSREEMQGIEPSSRLYKEDNTIFMTATMIAKSDSPAPTSDAITLILRENKLITVRYTEPQAFALFISHLSKLSIEDTGAIYLIIALLEASIDRLADISERIGRSLDDYSQTIFRTQKTEKIKLDYKKLLQELGVNGDLNAKAWESLASFNRLNVFFAQAVMPKINEEIQSKLMTLTKDLHALSDQVKFLSSKVNFLLDATLGMVNIEQNNIIKIFSIAAVIFLPPTLIASIYGMNFQIIPGLTWRFGYVFSIVLMLLSAWLPYQYFKIKKWL
jgi:magnesium transporter